MKYWNWLVLVLAVAVCGCASLPWPLPDPDPDPPSYVLDEAPIWTSSLPKVVGMIEAPDGTLLWTVCNVYHGANKSQVWQWAGQEARRLYEGTEETIGQPFLSGGIVYFPVEHGTHVLKYQAGRIAIAGRTKGRWSVFGIEWQGAPVCAYNDSYNGTMQDRPELCRADSGAELMIMDVRAMPRTGAELDGHLYVSANFGEEVLLRDGGLKWASPMLSLGVTGGRLYGGGGMKAGPRHLRQPDGRVYRWEGDKAKELHSTGSYALVQCVGVPDGLLFVGTDPDTLWHMTPGETFTRIVQIGDETPALRDRSFGGCAAFLSDGTIAFGRSDARSNTSQVWLLRERK